MDMLDSGREPVLYGTLADTLAFAPYLVLNAVAEGSMRVNACCRQVALIGVDCR